MEEELQKEVYFTEILALDKQNGFDCGFVALDVSRKEIVDHLLLNQDSKEIRLQLAPEVQNFLFEECSEIQGQEALMESVAHLLEKSNENPPSKATQGVQDVKDNECLSNFLALLLKEQQHLSEVRSNLAKLNEILGEKEGPKTLSQIASLHGDNIDPQIKTLMSDVFVTQNTLKNQILEFTSSKSAYLYYLENHYQNRGWIAFQRNFGETSTNSIIDVIADLKKWKIMVWMPILRDEPNLLQPLYSTNNATGGIEIQKEIRHIKFNGINHFTKLELLESLPADIFDDLNIHFTGRVIPSIPKNLDLENDDLEIEVNNESNSMIFQDMKVSDMNSDLMFEQSSSDFKRLVQSSVFVDKSLFLKRVLEHGRNWVITRPRRWGKTLNIRMLETFLENDIPNLRHNSQNTKYFIGGKDEEFNYRKLQISECKNIMEKFQGNHPVVFVTFKDVLVESFNGSEMIQIRKKIKTQFREVFKAKKYLEQNLEDEFEIERWKKISRCEDEDLTTILPFLGSLLKGAHKKDVFLIFDEHDRCVNNIIQEKAFIQGNDEGMKVILSEAAKLISGILTPCVKDSSEYFRSVVTGIYNTVFLECGSGVNNISYSSIEDLHFKEDFGLSKTEIEGQLLNAVFKEEDWNKTKEREVILKIMETHYNGYSMPSSFEEEENLSVYVPFSVISFVLDFYTLKVIPANPKSYWTASGSSEVIKNLSYIQCDETAFDQLFQLSQGNSVLFERNIKSLRLVEAFSKGTTNTLEEIVFYLLVNGGYVTRTHPTKNYFKIPNREILEYFSEVVLTAWVKKKGVGIEAPELCKLGEVIGPSLSQVENFQKALKTLLGQLPPGVQDEPELQALIYGGVMDYAIYKPKHATHKASIEKYSRNEKKELGKFDTILFPMKDNLNLIIHEYKVFRTSTNEGSIERMEEHAIWQIFVRHYMEEGMNRRAYINPFQKLEIRGIVCFQNDVNGGWNVSIKSVMLTIEEAGNIVQFFKNDETNHLRKVFSNNEDAATRKAKAELLKKCRVNNLDSLIESLKNPPSKAPKPDEMQIEDAKSEKPNIEESLHELFRTEKVKVRKETEIIQYIINNRETMIMSNNAEFRNSIQKNISGVGPKNVSQLKDIIIDQIKKIVVVVGGQKS